MRFETVSYIPTRPMLMLAEIKKQLPDYVNRELIDLPHVICVKIESHKTDIIAYLDAFFRVRESRDYVKHVSLEIDESEIDEFDYFRITLDSLEMGRDVFGNIIRPTCPSDACPVGSKLLSPVRLTGKKSKRIGIASIYRPWGQPNEYVLSSRLKSLFDQEQITGLEYEPCVIDDGAARQPPDVPAPYLARIARKISIYAEDIIPGHYICKEHSILSAFRLINDWVSARDLKQRDFVAIDKIEVKGKYYTMHNHLSMISRKVLKILLKNKIRGLVPIGFFLGQKFMPVIDIVDSEPQGTNDGSVLVRQETGRSS